MFVKCFGWGFLKYEGCYEVLYNSFKGFYLLGVMAFKRLKRLKSVLCLIDTHTSVRESYGLRF